MGLTGFICGALLGMAGANFISTGDNTVLLIGGIAGGAIGSVVAIGLYMVGVFLIGALGGVVIVTISSGLMNNEASGVLIAIGAIIGGVAGIILQKMIIIFSTSFVGSWSLVVGAVSVFYEPINPMKIITDTGTAMGQAKIYFALFWFWLVLGIVGVFVQYKIVKPIKKEEEDKK